MKRSKIKNTCLKSRSEEDQQRYVEQRNLCIIHLLFDLKRKKVTDNGKSWKSLPSNKLVNSGKITLTKVKR